MEIVSLENKFIFDKFTLTLKQYKMKRDKIIFYIATGLLTLLMLFSVSMYFFKHEDVSKMFTNFGYPTYIIYPYAVAKLLGIFAIWNPNFKTIKEWAYAGFFFDLVLASLAHHYAGHGIGLSVYAIILLVISYALDKKVRL